MKKQITITVALLFLLALLGVVGKMDADSAQLDADHYCDMVKAGHWPDYQGTYRRECLRPKSVPR